jgi:O-antigen biosynthesis protein
MKPLKIISLPVDDGGCGWYRVRQPFEMIKRFTPHDTHIISKDDDNMLAVAEALAQADIILVRQGGEGGRKPLENLVEKYGRELGTDKNITAKWVLDMDDNMEQVSPYNAHYEDYGIEEYYDSHLDKWLWKDGVAEFDVTRNRMKLSNFIGAMRSFDAITVTTDRLAEYAKQYNENVYVTPNCVNLERWWKLPLKKNKKLRVGWSGGASHYEDWYSIKEPLNELMRKYQFTLVVAGNHFEGVIDPDNRHLVETYDWMPFKGHSYRMMCAALDIAIIPLADLPFNHYKSSVKWYEMSAMGVPSVVAGIPPYRDDIRHTKTALAYSGSEYFYSQLENYLKSKGLREEIGSNARKWVEENRDARKCTDYWLDAYRTILDTPTST